MGRKRATTERELFLIHKLVEDGSKIRAACRAVAEEQGRPDWKVKQFEETARKTYAERRNAGTLPKEDPRKSLYVDAIRAEFARDESRKQEARRVRDRSLAEAASLGLNLDELVERVDEIHRELMSLVGLLTSSPAEVAKRLKSEKGAEELAVEHYRKLEERRGELEKQVALAGAYQGALHVLAGEGE